MKFKYKLKDTVRWRSHRAVIVKCQYYITVDSEVKEYQVYNCAIGLMWINEKEIEGVVK